ncbi:MAG: cobalamin B12-binding domain-containing protein [Archaeoglobus sp.]|uniref:cobalamin-dependent protein n=1 Tax=Archaeoglobus sp. TaxID=1872626 RepID=UPI001DD3BEC0|nr:cobalamin-dependent protein [Archaeoglobus sp.]MBO8179534.1 cobalamin B12-binding domain-containing protein [Archaeoglobus sp.]
MRILEAQLTRKIRVIVAKPGLDGHDRGAKVVARALRDAGFEVIYTGIRRTPEEIAETALQEDADVVGLSILSGAHLELTPMVIEELRKRGLEPNRDVLVLLGGIVPEEDVPKLKEMGVAKVFGPGTPLSEIIEFIRAEVPKLKR